MSTTDTLLTDVHLVPSHVHVMPEARSNVDQRRECLESLEALHHPDHFNTAVAIFTTDLHASARSRSIIGSVDWQGMMIGACASVMTPSGALDGQRIRIQRVGVGQRRERQV